MNVNDPPVANPDSYGVDADDTIVADDADGTTANPDGVLVNDTDVDPLDVLTVTEVNGSPANVGVSVPLVRSGSGPGGTVTVAADGTFVYDPGSDFADLDETESEDVTFTYTASDGALTSQATVTITVSGIDDTPTLDVADQTVNEGTTLTLDLDDDSFDPDGDTLTYSILSGPGSITGSEYTYIAGDGPAGPSSVEVEVSDGNTTSTTLRSVTVDDVLDVDVGGRRNDCPRRHVHPYGDLCGPR